MPTPPPPPPSAVLTDLTLSELACLTLTPTESNAPSTQQPENPDDLITVSYQQAPDSPAGLFPELRKLTQAVAAGKATEVQLEQYQSPFDEVHKIVAEKKGETQTAMSLITGILFKLFPSDPKLNALKLDVMTGNATQDHLDEYEGYVDEVLRIVYPDDEELQDEMSELIGMLVNHCSSPESKALLQDARTGILTQDQLNDEKRHFDEMNRIVRERHLKRKQAAEHEDTLPARRHSCPSTYTKLECSFLKDVQINY